MSSVINKVPKLRFPEFSDEWAEKRLGDLLEIKSASRVHKNEWSNSGVPFFRSSDVVAKFKGEENTKAFISNELFEKLSSKSGRVGEGDLLITGGGSIGIPYLVNSNGPLYFKDADLLWIRKSDKLIPFFLYTFFISPKFKQYLKNISHTGTISHYTIEQAKATPIALPYKSEQNKISSFLILIDEQIELMEKKLDLSKKYKNGVMQRIFSQKIRFKDENNKNFTNWKIKSIGDISFKENSPVSANEIVGMTGKYKVFGASGLLQTSEQYDQEEEYIAIVKDGAGVGRLGLYEAKSSVLGTLNIIKPKKGINTRFLYSLLAQIDFAKYSVGSTIPHVYFKDYSNEKFQIPENREQIKIAKFLSVIDDKINLQERKLEQAKKFKNALLQQMLV